MKGILSRLAAIFLLSIPGAYVMKRSENFRLTQLNGDPVAYVARQKDIIMKTGSAGRFFAVFLLGTFIVFCVEVVAFMIRGDWHAPRDSQESGD